MFKKKGSPLYGDAEPILSHEFYMHKCMLAAIDAPIKAIETGKMADGYATIRLSSYFMRKFAWAGRIIDLEEKELQEFLVKEKQKIIEAGTLEADPMFKVMVAVSTMAFIQKAFNDTKPIEDEYKI